MCHDHPEMNFLMTCHSPRPLHHELFLFKMRWERGPRKGMYVPLCVFILLYELVDECIHPQRDWKYMSIMTHIHITQGISIPSIETNKPVVSSRLSSGSYTISMSMSPLKMKSYLHWMRISSYEMTRHHVHLYLHTLLFWMIAISIHVHVWMWMMNGPVHVSWILNAHMVNLF